MTTNTAPSFRRSSPRLSGALRGAALGALTGTLLLGIGLIRIVLALFGGAQFGFRPRDMAGALAYVGMFAVTGAIVGFVRAQRPTTTRTQGGFALAGGIGAVLLMLLMSFIEGRVPSSDPWTYLMLLAFGSLVGLVFGTVISIKADAPSDTP